MTEPEIQGPTIDDMDAVLSQALAENEPGLDQAAPVLDPLADMADPDTDETDSVFTSTS